MSRDQTSFFLSPQFIGMIIIKLVMDSMIDPCVQSAFKPIFATIFIAPFAYFLEWHTFIYLFFKLLVEK